MDSRDINWKKYISYFKFWFLAILLLAVLLVVLLAVRGRESAIRRKECLIMRMCSPPIRRRL